MAKIENHFSKKNINVVIDGIRKQMSFQEIENLVISKGKPTRYDIGGNKSPMSIDNSIERFAQKFTVTFFTDYEKRVFKLNIEHNGATFWNVPVLTKTDLFNLTSPTLCQS
jgi:translation initiation factor RLI1